MRWLYRLISRLLSPLLVVVLLSRPKTRGGMSQRLGWLPPMPEGEGPRIWLHGSSAGDLLALEPIAKELRRRLPESTLVMSTFTDSGMALAERMRRTVDAVVYQPLDLPGATRRAAAAIRPDVLVLEYTELWPNLIDAAKRRGAKVVLSNGRLSPGKMDAYRRMFRLFGNPLTSFDRLLMRSADEAERARALGASPDRVAVAGNTKFDAWLSGGATAPPGLAEALGPAPIFLAGSTHQGEEEGVLAAFAAAKAKHPALRLVVAPRYLDRVGEVAAFAEQAGWSVARRSEGAAAAAAEVVLLDTMGELSAAYAHATVAFVGGSFTPRGGQNILEPASMGRPVLFGPNMGNFVESVALLRGNGGIQVEDADALGAQLVRLLDAPDERERLGRLAREAAASATGATRRIVDHLLGLLEIDEDDALEGAA